MGKKKVKVMGKTEAALLNLRIATFDAIEAGVEYHLIADEVQIAIDQHEVDNLEDNEEQGRINADELNRTRPQRVIA